MSRPHTGRAPPQTHFVVYTQRTCLQVAANVVLYLLNEIEANVVASERRLLHMLPCGRLFNST